MFHRPFILGLLAGTVVAACSVAGAQSGGDSGGTPVPTRLGDGGPPDGAVDGSLDATDAGDAAALSSETPGDSQTPPTGLASAIEQWLQGGAYKGWHCEATETAGSGVSPHGAHRVCSNDKLSSYAGAGEYPVGSANVKEVYDAVGGKVIGHSVALQKPRIRAA